MIGAYCRDCDDQRIMADYINTRRLSTSIITNVSLQLVDISRPWGHAYQDTRAYKHKTLRDIWEFGSVKDIEELCIILEIWASNVRIGAKIKEFENSVWFNGLQKVIRNSTKKGVSAKLGSVSCLTFSMCARTMITIENKEASVTMMCIEDSETPTMGFRGIDATERQAIDLINLMIESFKDGLLKFEEDTNVSYCGM